MLLTSKRRKRRKLRERTTGQASAKIDQKNGIIRNVKLLGAKSSNGRIYSESAMKQAARFYEGVAVRMDHKPEIDVRPVHDDVGIIKNVKIKDGAIYGDLHLLMSHPSANLILEKAEKAPNSFGFSHDADGYVEIGEDGIEHVMELQEVRSLDLVTKPATNKGLFESKRKRKIREQKARRLADRDHWKPLYESLSTNRELSERQRLERIQLLAGSPQTIAGDEFSHSRVFFAQVLLEAHGVMDFGERELDRVVDAGPSKEAMRGAAETVSLARKLQERRLTEAHTRKDPGIAFPSDSEGFVLALRNPDGPPDRLQTEKAIREERQRIREERRREQPRERPQSYNELADGMGLQPSWIGQAERRLTEV